MGLNRYRIADENWDYFQEIHFFSESFRFYITEIDRFINQEIDASKRRYQTFIEQREEDPSYDMEWPDHFFDLQAKVNLTDIYYDSMIMTLYAFVERKMAFLSNHLSDSQAIKVNDIYGNGIFKYRTYLSKVCDVSFTEIEDHWKTLTSFNKLRNHLVHSEGNRRIPLKNSELISFLRATDGVEVSANGNSVNFHFSNSNILQVFLSSATRIIDHLYRENVSPQE